MEVLEINGKRISPQKSRANNPAFDVTPSRLITALITERGVTVASQAGLKKLYSDVVT